MRLVEAIALRELAEHCREGGLVDLEATTRAELAKQLARLGGRISAEQFSKVGFRP
jgi:hypothetical protein